MTLDELHCDVVRLARVSGKLEVAPFVPEMTRTRDRIYRLLDERQHPKRTTDLYFLAGVICGVLADATDCLGYRAASMTHARAALMYADIAGHNSLRVWCRTMQASLAQSDDRPQHAVAYSRAGQDYTNGDAARAWIYSSEGQALALMGDRQRAAEAFRIAQAAAEIAHDRNELFDDIGGTFQYSIARIHRSMSLGYIQAKLTTEAIVAAQHGLDVFTKGSQDKRDYGNEASSSIRLGTAYVLAGQLDAAKAALGSVFALPLNLRIAWLEPDIKQLRRTLATLSDQRSQEFQELQSGAEDFVASLLSPNTTGIMF